MNGQARLTARAALVVVAATAAALAVLPAASAHAAATGRAFLVQGVADKTLDLVVDGKDVAPGAKPKTIVGPLNLVSGAHQLVARSGGAVITQARFTVRSGRVVDVVVHRLSDMKRSPEITTFQDDLTPVGPGKVRLAVAHVAAAPPADIQVDGSTLFRNVANGEALTVLVPAKTYSVQIVPAATHGPAILGPVSLPLQAGTLTRVFAIGDVTTKSMDAVVHTIPVRVSGSRAPGSVPTGDGGQLASQLVDVGGISPLGYAGIAGAGLVVLAGGNRMRRRWLRR